MSHLCVQRISCVPHPQEVLGEKARRIRELTALVQYDSKFPKNTLEFQTQTWYVTVCFGLS
jgi:hypothetical protein